MLTTRQISIVPPGHQPRPAKFPLPLSPGLSLPAATIQTSLRWQRLLATQTSMQEQLPQLRLEEHPRS